MRYDANIPVIRRQVSLYVGKIFHGASWLLGGPEEG